MHDTVQGGPQKIGTLYALKLNLSSTTMIVRQFEINSIR